MAMYDLDSDERDTDRITWSAGGRSHLVIMHRGRRLVDTVVRKSDNVTLAYSDDLDNAPDVNGAVITAMPGDVIQIPGSTYRVRVNEYEGQVYLVRSHGDDPVDEEEVD